MYQSIPNFNISSLGNPYYTYIHFYSNSFFHKFKKGIQYFKFQLVNIPIPQAKSDVQSLRSQSNAPTTGKKQVVEKRGGSQKGGGEGGNTFCLPYRLFLYNFFFVTQNRRPGPIPQIHHFHHWKRKKVTLKQQTAFSYDCAKDIDLYLLLNHEMD